MAFESHYLGGSGIHSRSFLVSYYHTRLRSCPLISVLGLAGLASRRRFIGQRRHWLGYSLVLECYASSFHASIIWSMHIFRCKCLTGLPRLKLICFPVPRLLSPLISFFDRHLQPAFLFLPDRCLGPWEFNGLVHCLVAWPQP